MGGRVYEPPLTPSRHGEKLSSTITQVIVESSTSSSRPAIKHLNSGSILAIMLDLCECWILMKFFNVMWKTRSSGLAPPAHSPHFLLTQIIEKIVTIIIQAFPVYLPECLPSPLHKNFFAELVWEISSQLRVLQRRDELAEYVEEAKVPSVSSAIGPPG